MTPTSLNLSVRGLRPSATLAINERSAELERSGRRVFRLGLGQSPFPVPPTVVEALRTHAGEKDYLPVKGLPELRRAVAAFHTRRDLAAVSEDNVLIGPGSKELMFLLQLVFYGDLVVPTPCWVSYVPQAQIIGRPVRLLHTRREDGWRLTAQQLADFCASEQDDSRPRVVFLNYPGNPDGLTYSATELQALAEVARRHRMVLLSDEIYGQLHHRGEHVSIARYYPEGTIISSGLSKWAGAGGWRLGTFAFPPDLRWLLDAMAVVASETYTSVTAPIQYAAVVAFEGGDSIESYLVHARRILSALGTQCAQILRQTGVDVADPTGAFYLFPDFSPLRERLAARGVTTSRELCEQLLQETGVAVLPGADFQRAPEELTARLAYVNFDGARALGASESVPIGAPLPADTINECCNDTLEGVQRLADWVSQ